ncbi:MULTISPECIES: threonine synthase [unclassified Actinomyces]|uniref:threonine synthase n=1 Tax=unclassified Actinomyces TaxID=2609248 RepID=UPI002017D7F3|nr:MULTISPECIES: threonine synthase [unclassified Actinomyces]MCL3778557.1 threonine synthase [Actinomyces sp. AC-20-1]MCL3789510.1 threonine synthase [Actinomyces sp. 187325]MCL3791839.1 threonine synthase [Actinomyces sp. 186855]MCL3793518.1 threonine synthase [Actinomyces sp. 217892]
MQFISTRGGMEPVGFTDVLLTGLAPDGGLAVPVGLPALSGADLEEMRPLPYAELAARVIGLYATDIPEPDLLALTRAAYGQERFPDPVVPVTGLDQAADGLVVVGLSEGPTMAFKDLAMQFLGQAIPYVLRRQGRVLNILGATSGDTGSAAEHAFKGQDGVSVFMLSPAGRMSEVQRAQMYSLDDANIHNIAVEGVFDDCQNLVKAVNADQAFKSRYAIGAVNSINFGRIAAQVVYYVWAWLRVTDELPAAERSAYRVDVAVPSGNFGNIYAGHLAREMGLPLRRLILATNENNVLDEFFRTGVYAPRASEDTLATSSPSMDISKASNLERFLWTLLGPEAFVRAWQLLEEDGRVDLSEHVATMRERYGFVSASSTHADRLTAIRVVHATAGTLIDPHTADGVTVALRLMQPGFPTLVLETAKAAKFSETVAEALGAAPEPDAVLRALLKAEQHVETIANDVDALRALIEKDALATEEA